MTRETLERVEIKLILLTEGIKRRARTNRVRREREYTLGPQSRHFAETKEGQKGPKEAYPDTSGDSDPKRPSRMLRSLDPPESDENQILKGRARAP